MGWAQAEMETISFIDKRLDKRSSKVLEALGNNPSLSIPAACGGWAETKAAYNFFRNEDVTLKKIMKAHREATFKRMEHYDTLLFISDTTEVEYSGSKEIGILRHKEDYGFLLHPIIVITPERLCLGVTDAELLYRKELGKKKLRKKRPIEEKESYRWIRGYRKINEIANQFPDKRIISISDSESDIYELLAETQSIKGDKAQWVIRSAYDRRVEKTEAGLDVKGKLWEEMYNAPAIAEVSFKLKRRDGKAERLIKQKISTRKIKLSPCKKNGVEVCSIEINAVLAYEVEPPQGEEPVEWLLLTSLPVEEANEALEILRFYLARWEVEVFFKILKSGCKIEELQLENQRNIEPCIAMYMITAWRVMYLMMLGRETPEMDSQIIFHEYEWKSVYVAVKKEPPPQKAPTLGEMIKLIAKLGGYLNRARDGVPGPKVIWIGIQRMKDIALGWEIAHTGLLGLKPENYG